MTLIFRKTQCFNLHGKLSSNWQCKITMGDYLQEQFIKALYTVNFGLYCENKEKDTSHANNQHTSGPYINMSCTRHHNICQNSFLSRPHKLHINHWQQQPPKDTISSTLTQDKDTTTVHIALVYILIIDFKLPKSTLHPLRTHYRLPKST